VIPELVDQDIEALIEQARLQRPDLMASEAQLKASLAKIELLKLMLNLKLGLMPPINTMKIY
jgi:hypothetical protein